MNKGIRFASVLALFAVLAVSAFGIVGAQDATAVPAAGAAGSINCDSDLILNLYIAENYFGFDQVRNQLMMTATTSMTDLTAYNRGQYGPWFDASTAMMTNPVLTDDQVTTLSGMLSQDDATLQSTLNGGAAAGTTTTAPLVPLAVPGEAAECAQLRTELARFFQVVAFEHGTGAMSFGNTGSTVMPANPDTAAQPGAVTTNMPEATPDMTLTPAS